MCLIRTEMLKIMCLVCCKDLVLVCNVGGIMGNLVLKGNYLFGVTFYKKHTNTRPLRHPLLKQGWIFPAMLHISTCLCDTYHLIAY